uniref:Uncharacterized protein n=1 Tax=Riptortus pedestris TaxID=329032 RepID=R4WR29_RIPPE|nr:unknown secreted protein [Riptortus pedestris]
MMSIKFFLFLVVAVACVLAFPAEESERVKKQVLLGSYPYAYSAYSAPIAYSAYPYATGYYL